MAINKEDAKRVAFDYISSIYAVPDDEPVILDELTIEKEYGWIFFYQSKTFLETEDISYALAGNGPVLVEGDSGSVVQFGTAYDVEYYVK